ncbi:MAG: HD domain-containing protein [Myxococcota bacterium]|nr:HD domain-containing protein [Myxococcota bacterium]
MTMPPDMEIRRDELPEDPVQADRVVPGLVRERLRLVREHLAELHRETSSGRIVNERNSDLMDRLIRSLFALSEERVLMQGGKLEQGLCVVAVGGFARREMSIHSDLDLLILYRDELTPYVSTVAERLQYWLWDAGGDLGCATRTIEDTLAMGRADVTVRTTVLTGRFLCGDGEFFHDFADTMRRELLQDVPAFIREQCEIMEARHKNFGESLFLLQPNVKEGEGALRDYHAAYWIARGSQPSLRNLDDFLHFGLLTEREIQEYRSALDFLWHVRNELHLRVGRAHEQMSFEMQEYIARNMGYGSMDEYTEGESAGDSLADSTTLAELRFEPDDPDLPVERFMRDYYRHARSIKTYSDLVISQCVSRAENRGVTRLESVEVEEGFRLADDHLEIPHATHLRERPIRCLLVFEVAQNHEVPLSRIAQRILRENLSLFTDAQRCDPSFRACFMRILNAPHRVTRTLTAMNDIGVLAAFIPEWEHIVCRWQHVLYHSYTVDVHSIFLVEELRRLWRGRYAETMPDLSELMQELEDRPALFLGCLLHDIGKGFGGEHSRKGVVRAKLALDRLGLGGERAERILFVVEHHLLMSHLAQSRDVSDPKLILELAQLCGDRTNLRNLYLATVADIRACSKDAWTDWKGQLLREVYERTAEMLEIGADDPDKAMELLEARVEVRQQSTRDELARLGVDQAQVEGFFAGMPRRYFVSHTPRQIARHAQVVFRHWDSREFETAFREMRGDFTEFILCTRDAHGLFSQVAGVLSAHRFNILGSNVYTSREGMALEVYRVSTPAGGEEERALALSDFEVDLRKVLAGESDVEELINRRRRGRLGLPSPPSPQPSRVLISNTESDFYTVVDVIAHDRLGLLHDVTRCLGEHGLEIYISKAATIKDQVTDSFYLRDPRGKKLRDEEALLRLRQDLLNIAQSPSGPEADEDAWT